MHSTKERATETKIVEGTSESITKRNSTCIEWKKLCECFWRSDISRELECLEDSAIKYKKPQKSKKKKLSSLLDCRICLRLKNNSTNGFMSLPGGR